MVAPSLLGSASPQYALSVGFATILLFASPLVADSIVIVQSGHLNGWSIEVFGDGGAEFVDGPAPPPFGRGSLRMSGGLSAPDDGATLLTDQYSGTPLADLTDLSFRLNVAAHPNNPNYTGTFGFTVDYDGVGGNQDEFLFFDAVYNGYQQEMDVWQTWDVLNADVLWSFERGGPPPTGTTVSVADLLVEHPNATLLIFGYGVGGTPPSTELFDGYIDGITLGVLGETTTCDLEPPIFTDGFESGDTSAWSASTGESPHASFTSSPIPDDCFTYNFDSTSAGSPPLTCAWDFDGAQVEGCNTQTHTFSEVGASTRPVFLTVTNPIGSDNVIANVPVPHSTGPACP